MRVCLVTTSYPRWGGDAADTFLGALARHLAGARGLDVTVLAPGSPDAPARERCGRLRVHRVAYFWPRRLQRLAYGAGVPWNLAHRPLAWLNLPCFLAAMGRAILRHAPHCDVIHAHWGGVGALAVGLRRFHRRPVVLTVHGSDWRSGLAPIRWATRWAVRRADAVTTPSREFHAEMAGLREGRGRCCFIPNAVELPPLEDLARPRGSSAAGPHIISVGRLIPQRRHDLLIGVLAALRPRFPGATLTLVGDGPARAGLERQARDLGLAEAVQVTGWLDPAVVSRCLKRADLYVSPTTVESFGMAVAEAAAHGLPVVTTRVGYAAHLVLDGETGYVVAPGDADALAVAVAKALADPEGCRRMGRRGRRRVEDLGLVWPKVAARFADLYAALAAERDPSRVPTDPR